MQHRARVGVGIGTGSVAGGRHWWWVCVTGWVCALVLLPSLGGCLGSSCSNGRKAEGWDKGPCTDPNHFMTCEGGEGYESDHEKACPSDAPMCVATTSYDHVCQSADPVDCVTPVVGAAGVSLRAADLNGDGLSDLVYLNGDALTIALAGPSNQFVSAATAASGVGEFRLAQLNADGALDLVALSRTGQVSVLFGNGDGSFAAERRLLSGGQHLLGAGDLDGDGVADPILQQGTSHYVWLSSATDFASVELALTLPGQAQQAWVTSGPSGAPELVIGDDLRQTSVFARAGAGWSLLQLLSGYLVLADDFNHDGQLDLVLTMSDKTVLELGQGGNFEPQATIAGAALLAADVNADGNLDLEVQRSNALVPLHGHGDGTFAEGRVLGIQGWSKDTVFVTTAQGGALIYGTYALSQVSPSCVMR
jgi:hypothetical protein